MRKYITIATFIAAMAVLYAGCAEGNNRTSTTMRTTQFDGAQGNCANGGIKAADAKAAAEKKAKAAADKAAADKAAAEAKAKAAADKAAADKAAAEKKAAEAKAVGDKITFGNYEQDNNTANGKEPIVWRVLDRKSNGQLLIISEKVLDMQKYNTTGISITWEKSTIRSWLNGYDASYNTVGTDFTDNNFINTAFTATERDKIVASNVPAHLNPHESGTPAGNPTKDKIFLLSITEANNYFSSDDDRKADATRYAVKQGVYVKGSTSGKYTSNGTCIDDHCFAYWWLRSPGYRTVDAAYVYAGGSVDDLGNYVNNVHLLLGVRPALWVNY